MPKQSSSQISFVNSNIEDLSNESINSFVQDTNLNSNSLALLSVPAGYNRSRNLKPAISLAAKLTEQIPELRVCVELRVDDTELEKQKLSVDDVNSYPEVQSAQKKIKQLQANGNQVYLEAVVQLESNSVFEVVQAMHRAAEIKATHLIAPRHGRSLKNRVSLTRHFFEDVNDSTLSIFTVPRHKLSPVSLKETLVEFKRGLLELASLSVCRTILFSKGVKAFKHYIENKGLMGKLAEKMHGFKIDQIDN